MAVILNHRKSTYPDWVSVPPELLYLITRKLSDLPDFMNFRAVCRSWRSSVPISDPPQKCPLIIEERDNLFLPDHLRFFSLSTGKVFMLPFPNQIICEAWIGPTLDGYLLVGQYPSNNTWLFNPLTHHQILLPSFDDSRLPRRILQRSGDYVIGCSESFDPSSLALFRLGDKKWNIVGKGCQFTKTCICVNGMFFSYDCLEGKTKIVEIATRDLISVVPSPMEETQEFVWLVESFGDILMVVSLESRTNNHYDFGIYKLKVDFDNANHNPCWVRTESIGDRVLFICGKTGISFKAGQFHGMVGNCIYIKKLLAIGGSIIFRYSIEDGGIEKISCPFNDWHVFVPTLQYLNASG
ncbi:hypothetical protein LUZ63_013154 [Rhynchospora breviuscula]|uniref:F-box domain-containing protein n=1 Tax=Rhynchospora breviuscula TaxID=2022672 RepID=A0A9Q0C8C4_9POAL|nr:hypothetical protein LUZ63_013154 [Rhynchospora breviuscula]